MNRQIPIVVLASVLASPALAQSRDPSMAAGNIDRSVMTAPIGQRQPRTVDLPATNMGDNASANAPGEKLDRVLRICRGC